VVHSGKAFIPPPFWGSNPLGYLPLLHRKPFIHPQPLIVKTLIHIFI